MTRILRAGIILALVSACSDGPPPIGPCTDCPPDLLVSDPVTAPVFAAARGAEPAFAITGGDRTAYVSLPPGTVPFGAVAEISRKGEVESATTVVVDGGFDPVPIAAEVGDSLVIRVKRSERTGGEVLFERRVAVKPSRPPIVVRTQPPRKKTQVAINGAVLVYFSEPVDGATITTSSIRLLRGATAVAGTVRFLDATRLAVEFVPEAPLASGTDYELRVTTGVRDLSGAALAAPLSVTFTTGESLTGAPASMRMTPDSTLTLARGATYPLAATVRDAEGTVLSNQQVVWFTSDPAGLAISASGLVTAQRAGNYFVTASAGELSRSLMVFVPVPPAAVVQVFRSEESVPAGSMTTVIAQVYDANGLVIANAPVTWTSSNTSIATVVSADSASYTQGRVTGVSPGTVTITATSGTASGAATIAVTAPLPVASVSINPRSGSLLAGGATQFTAMHYDATGRVILGRPTAWTSSNTSVARVDENGRVTGINTGAAIIRATSEGVSDTAAVAVITIDLAAVSAGYRYACGVTTAGVAYCWGDNLTGQLGSTTSGTLLPVSVMGNHTFSSISAGEGSIEYAEENPHTCGLRTDGAAYCWGSNVYGELGSSSAGSRSFQPQAVSGGLSFTAISAGAWHTCALTSTGAAYCWGWATGTDGVDSPVPVPIAGGHVFTTISAGAWRTCGITNTGVAYCWEWDARGNPSPVPGGLTFRTVSVGEGHSCAVTVAGAAYCWGANESGQLGNGSTNASTAPVAVTGGLAFIEVSAGHFYSCGVTTGGSAYCWGRNDTGQLGDGSTTWRAAPVPVSGGLTLTSITTGHQHSCGLTAAGITYCWGTNGFGEMGNGTRISSQVPVKIAGQP